MTKGYIERFDAEYGSTPHKNGEWSDHEIFHYIFKTILPTGLPVDYRVSRLTIPLQFLMNIMEFSEVNIENIDEFDLKFNDGGGNDLYKFTNTSPFKKYSPIVINSNNLLDIYKQDSDYRLFYTYKNDSNEEIEERVYENITNSGFIDKIYIKQFYQGRDDLIVNMSNIIENELFTFKNIDIDISVNEEKIIINYEQSNSILYSTNNSDWNELFKTDNEYIKSKKYLMDLDKEINKLGYNNVWNNMPETGLSTYPKFTKQKIDNANKIVNEYKKEGYILFEKVNTESEIKYTTILPHGIYNDLYLIHNPRNIFNSRVQNLLNNDILKAFLLSKNKIIVIKEKPNVTIIPPLITIQNNITNIEFIIKNDNTAPLKLKKVDDATEIFQLQKEKENYLKKKNSWGFGWANNVQKQLDALMNKLILDNTDVIPTDNINQGETYILPDGIYTNLTVEYKTDIFDDNYTIIKETEKDIITWKSNDEYSSTSFLISNEIPSINFENNTNYIMITHSKLVGQI